MHTRARKFSLRFIPIISLLLLSCVCVRGAEAEKAPAIADILPEGTIMFADVRPWAEWSKDFSNTAIAKIFSEPEVRAFLAGPSNQISSLIKKATEARAGDAPKPAAANTPEVITAALDVLSGFTPGPFSIAVRYSAEDAQAKARPAVAVIVGYRDEKNIEAQKDVLAGVVDAMLKNWNVEFIKVTDYQNCKLISFTPVGADGQRTNVITLTLHKGRVIVSNEAKLCTQILDGIAGKLDKKLTDSPTYKSCGLAGDEHLSAYLDIAGLQNALGAMEKAAPDTTSKLDDFLVLAGLNKSSAVAWSLKMTGPAFESRTAIFSTADRAGLLGTLDDQPLSPGALKICPANTPFAAGFHLRQDHVLPFLRNAVKALQGDKGLANFNAVEKELNLEKGLREAYGNELVITSLAGQENAGPIGAVSAFAGTLSIQDPVKANDVLENLLKQIAAKTDPDGVAANVLKEVEHDGVKVRYLIEPPVAGVIKFSPAFAIVQDRLVMALDVPTLKRAMKILKEGGSLADSKSFQEAVLETGGTMGPMFNYVDWGYLYKSVFNLGSDALKLVAPGYVLQAIGLDMNLLPETETVAQHLFPGLSIARITPNGIIMTSRSPLPSVEVLSPPLAAITAAIASFKPFMMPLVEKK